ncbi:trigger factor [Desulfacinum hydrothermale DSM 13146]|uniref:Trigger factor n=1 Tax=Desulfacinum hydrothermale DSM 13146 TaxID=1121390 RepID=A0A1W1X7S1_9BACT|nr:trigger factor [Desulfacinum hydrothermale]SMC19999.1 trigger factor [Desulfacinum hydrothermale DSM 13146]
MKVSVTDVSATQKKLQVVVPADRVQKELDRRYRQLAKQVRIKGFRPGKVPRKILQSYYGKTVEGEVSNQLIQETYPDALKEADIKPLMEGDVDDFSFDESGTFTYTALVEVQPEFQVDDYLGLEVEKPDTTVTDEMVEQELENLRDRHAEIRTVEEDREARLGDVAVVDFTPFIDGELYEKGKTDDFNLELGTGSLHPQFDDQVVGHRAGETFEFDLDYPEDAENADLAGKTVHFQVTLKELKEKVLPDLDDEFAKKGGDHDSLEGLKESVRERLQKSREQASTMAVRQSIVEQLTAKADFELSEKVVDREVDRRINQFVHQFSAQGINLDPARFNTPEIRQEQRPQAERDIRWRLIVEQIAKQEQIELSEEEKEAVYQDVARLYRTTADDIRENYQESAAVQEMIQHKLEEKVLKLLEDNAVAVAPSKEEEPQQAEE